MHRRSIAISVAITVMLQPAPALAILGAGDVVTDPGSYAYFADQVKIAYDQLESMKEQLDTAMKSYDKINETLAQTEKIKKKLEGAYNFAANTLDNIKHINNLPEEVFSPIGRRIERDAERLGNPDGHATTWEELGKEIEKMNEQQGPGNVDRAQYREGALYASLLAAEQALAKLKERNARLEELISKAKSADNVNEQQAVTSALLAQMLAGQNELILLISNMAKAEAAAKYQGKSKNEEAIKGDPNYRSQFESDADEFGGDRDKIKRPNLKH